MAIPAAEERAFTKEKRQSGCEKVLIKYFLRDRHLVCFTFETVM